MGCNYANFIFLKALHLLISLTIKMCTLKVQSSKLSNAGDIIIHYSSGFLKAILCNIGFSNSIIKDFLWSISTLVTFRHLIIMKKYLVKKQNLLE